MTKKNEKHEKREYFNLSQILKKDVEYDFTIGERDKGKNYALLQRKQLELGR